jgi:hypothetical protein
MKFDMIQKCCWGKERGRKKNAYLFNKPYWCDGKQCSFWVWNFAWLWNPMKLNERLWMKNSIFFFKITKYEPFWNKHYQYFSGQSDDCHSPKPMVACEWSLNIPRSQWCLTFDTLKVMTFTIILCTYFFFGHVSLSSHSNPCSALANSFYPLLEHFQLVQELHCTKHIVIYNLSPHIASH